MVDPEIEIPVIAKGNSDPYGQNERELKYADHIVETGMKP